MKLHDYILRKKIVEQLYKVIDPELFISIVDLGLIYDITIEKKKIIITITLTTIGCPLSATIEKNIRESIALLKNTSVIDILIVFDPPWSPQMISPSARAELGIE
jgi:metal-sulfur cluster biosynthetic enzyme